MSEERDSQLSAMFDGELPGAECELVARRAARDDLQRAQWARYAVIGAAIRKDAGVPLDLRVAERVQRRISAEASLGNEDTVVAGQAPVRVNRWLRPVAGLAIAASVAAVSVMALRTREVGNTDVLVASSQAIITEAPVARASSEPERYVVPAVTESSRLIAPAQLANYVVAHSEVSMPLSRRNLLTSLVASEPIADESTDAVPAPAIESAAADATR